MARIFYYCENLKSIDFGNKEFSSNYSFYYTFAYCSKLTSIDLSKFTNTSSNINFNVAFKYCSSLTSITFPSVSYKILYFEETFYGCSSLITIDLSNWVTNSYSGTIANTFYLC